MSELKTNINWFPGHMAKARRQMQENSKMVDMIIEVRDARIPLSSENPLLNEVCPNKPRLIVLAKKDKAEKEETAKWVKYLSDKGNKCIALDLLHDNVTKAINDGCTTLMAEKIAKKKAKGLRVVEIRAMVVGIPNVGKSTLINSVSRKKAAKTGDHPGVTTSLQWIKVSSEVALLDTPGVLWPKFEDALVAKRLALTGAIKDEVVVLDDIISFALDFLIKNHPDKLVKRYEIEVSDNSHETLDRIGFSRKTLKDDNSLDYERLLMLVLRDIRDNNLGAISWEKCDECHS